METEVLGKFFVSIYYTENLSFATSLVYFGKKNIHMRKNTVDNVNFYLIMCIALRTSLHRRYLGS